MTPRLGTALACFVMCLVMSLAGAVAAGAAPNWTKVKVTTSGHVGSDNPRHASLNVTGSN